MSKTDTKYESFGSMLTKTTVMARQALAIDINRNKMKPRAIAAVVIIHSSLNERGAFSARAAPILHG